MRSALVWTGSEYGLAWTDCYELTCSIYFTRVGSTGEIRGERLQVSSPSLFATNLSLAWTGSEFGIAWQHTREGDLDVSFLRISAGGETLGEPSEVAWGGGNAVSPSLAWSGSEMAVAWNDSRDGNQQIYLARLDREGRLASGSVRVTWSGTDTSYPSIAWSQSEVALAWSDGTPTVREIYFGRYRP